MKVMRLPSLLDDFHHSPIEYSPLAANEVATLVRDPRVVNFDAEVVLARHYCSQLFNQAEERRTFTDRQVHLADDLAERLEQVNFLCKTVVVLARRYLIRPDEKPLRPPHSQQLWFMIYLNAESFYYFAHRVQDILRKDKRGNLPFVADFVPCEQIIQIRNDLIEHAYLKPSLLESGGAKHSLSLNAGPIIHRSGETKRVNDPPDRGMFVNARALKNAVHPVLERALDAVGGRVDAETLMPSLRTRTKRGQKTTHISQILAGP